MGPSEDSKICEGDGSGLLLPFSKQENELPNALRGVMYAVGLVYCFLGVSIVADTFMGSIEEITSRRRQVRLKSGKFETVRIWNDTVANLTLMALGSSAPEIMLSIIELLKNGMYSGELGPSTIVGSAAFNLLMIIAVCIVVIPAGEARRIRLLSVFKVTMVFSLFAYIWLVVILQWWTPDVVTLIEALATLLFMPLLVYISYLADIGKLSCLFREGQNPRKVRLADGTTEELDEYVAKLCGAMGYSDQETLAELKKVITSNRSFADKDSGDIVNDISVQADLKELESAVNESKRRCMSRAQRRIEATRAFTGGRRASAFAGNGVDVQNGVERLPVDGLKTYKLDNTCRQGSGLSDGSISGSYQSGASKWSTQASRGSKYSGQEGPSIVEILCEEQSVSRDVVAKPVLLMRRGAIHQKLDVQFTVHYVQLEQGPVSKNLTEPEIMRGTASFPSDQRTIEIWVQRPTMIPSGCSDAFALRLLAVDAPNGGPKPQIGRTSMVTVTVVPAGALGRLVFDKEKAEIQGLSSPQQLQVVVSRLGGCSGRVACKYHTKAQSAVPGYDFEEVEGSLVFAEGVTEQVIDLTILPKGRTEVTDQFLLIACEPEGGIEFDPDDDGGAEAAILTVIIKALDVQRTALDRFFFGVDLWINLASLRRSTWDWIDQFPGAMYVNGDPEAQAEATLLDWFFHLVALPWKLIFTLVPPTSYLGGWVCFWGSLVFIAIITAVIGDLAELFGCVLFVPDSVTAITFVALGTSMPDLFASQTAAVQDPWADASVCNVTGSNSVNVFLGLGLPWTMAALYWTNAEWDERWADHYSDIITLRQVGPESMVFIVPAGNFAFNVSMFCGAALVALGILNLRRKAFGAELGGPRTPKVTTATAFVVLWFSYVVLTSWQVLRGHIANEMETITVAAITIILNTAATAWCLRSMLNYMPWRRDEPEDTDRTEAVAPPSTPYSPQDTKWTSLEEMIIELSAEPSPEPAASLQDSPTFGQEVKLPIFVAPQAKDGNIGSPQAAEHDAEDASAAQVPDDPGQPLSLGVREPTFGEGNPVALLSPEEDTAVPALAPSPIVMHLVNIPNATRDVATFRQHDRGQWSPRDRPRPAGALTTGPHQEATDLAAAPTPRGQQPTSSDEPLTAHFVAQTPRSNPVVTGKPRSLSASRCPCQVTAAPKAILKL